MLFRFFLLWCLYISLPSRCNSVETQVINTFSYFNEKVHHFGIYAYSLVCWELDEEIDSLVGDSEKVNKYISYMSRIVTEFCQLDPVIKYWGPSPVRSRRWWWDVLPAKLADGAGSLSKDPKGLLDPAGTSLFLWAGSTWRCCGLGGCINSINEMTVSGFTVLNSGSCFAESVERHDLLNVNRDSKHRVENWQQVCEESRLTDLLWNMADLVLDLANCHLSGV